MEKIINSYYGMAYNDYCYARGGMQVGEQLGNYNGVASLCAQAAEKYLKALLEVAFAEGALSLMHSHNLRAITNKLKEKYPELEISSKDIKWLGDFYFDARYPGDNFVEVNLEDAQECLRITEALQQKVTTILEGHEIEKQKKMKQVQELESFDI